MLPLHLRPTAAGIVLAETEAHAVADVQEAEVGRAVVADVAAVAMVVVAVTVGTADMVVAADATKAKPFTTETRRHREE